MVRKGYMKEEIGINNVPAIILETTNECRACACPGCYMIANNRSHKAAKMIDSVMAADIFDLVKNQNTGKEADSVDLIGGEPMESGVWPQVKKIIDIALDRGITPRLFTNGMYMTPEDAQWLEKKGVFVTMKLNIGNPNDPKELEIQAEMIGRNIQEAKRLVNGLYTALNAGLKDPQLSVENLVRGGRNSNVPLVPEFYELGFDLGFKQDIELMGNGVLYNWEYFTLAPTIQQVRWMIDQIIMIRDTKRLNQCAILMPHIKSSCQLYDKALYFQANGDIQPCSNNKTTLANLRDQDPIGKAVGNSVIQVRRNLTQDKMVGPCSICDIWAICKGGCRATVESFGNPYGSYPLCGVQRKFDDPRDIIRC